MNRRKLAMIFLPAPLLALAMAGAFAWLQYTESGARWIWSQASTLAPGILHADDIRGTLRSGLSLNGLTFATESISVKTGTLQLRLDFELFPLVVSVESLVADRITIKQLVIPDPGPGAGTGDLLSAFSLPVPLELGSIQLGQLVYQAASGTTAFESSNLSFSGRWHKELLVRMAELRTPAAFLQIRGEVGFSPPYAVDTTVDSRIELPVDGTSPPPTMQLQASLKGTISDLEVQAKLDQPAVSLQGHIRNLLDELSWELQLSGDALRWPLDGDTPQVTLEQVSARSSGSLQHYALESTGELGISGLPVLSAELHGEGDTKGMRIDDLRLSGEQVQLLAQGPVSWLDGLRIALTSKIDRLDPGLWTTAWPQDHPLHGDLDLDWQQDHVVLHGVHLAAPGDIFKVRGKGEIDLAADVIKADLEWDLLNWPPGASKPDFSSDHGKVQVQGRLADWSVAGTLHLQAGQWPGGLLTITGKGDRESIQVLVERGEVLGGGFDGQFSYRWADQQPWSAKIHAQNLDISPLSSTFPGVISAAFSARGQSEPMEFDIDIEQLAGTIRGHSVEARGGISLKTGQVYARDLQVRSGKSHLELDGSSQSPEGIRFSGHVESLGELLENASGNIEGKGRFLANAQGVPRIEIDLLGSELSWGDWRLETLSASQAPDLENAPATRIVLNGLSFGDSQVDELSLTLGGQNPLDDIRLEGRRNGTQLEASLAGSISDWSALGNIRWNGEIKSMRLENEDLGFLELEQAARLAIDSSSMDAGPACLRGPHNGQICFDASWKGGENLTAHARLDSMSLNLVPLLLDTDLEFSQTLSGELALQKSPGAKPSAEVRIESSPGQISIEGEETTLNTGPGLFSFRIIDGQLLAGNLDIALPGAGIIDTDFSAPDISRGRDSAIAGRIQVQFDNIEPVLQWIPMAVDRIAGSVNADIRLSGTLTDPRLTGHASLVRGQIEYGASGTVLTDITLAGAVYDFNYTELNGRFKMGEGQGSIKAAVKFDDIFKPDVTLEFSGQNLNLVNVPDMTVTADPDLHLHWHDSLLNLDGKILIPVARISPRYLPSASASESPDLVVTGGAEVIPVESVFDSSKLRLNGKVVVALGKEVTVTLERATARLKGKVAFTWNDNLLPIADGSYTLTGKITAYGQLLKITEGRISFPHVPADNPHLNINAEREIYGNLQVKEAGVLMTGTLKRPILEPYTIPMTTRERALTLLVTGHDFDYEQGVGGVEVGMYLAPKLYVSYGIGLFESQSVISARYDLKHGFGVKATSGQRETGVDISYTIEH